MEAVLWQIRIAGLSAAVPSHEEIIASSAYADEAARKRFSAATGIYRRRICPPDLFFSDLALAAAERLIDEMGWDKNEIQSLVVVTQTGDTALPATACILQDRLGLSTNCAAFDINLGCSGFPYGLLVAGRLLEADESSKCLLLIGDAAGKPNPIASQQAPLFGDAACAIAVERNSSSPPMSFSLHTDGSGWDVILERRPAGRPAFEMSEFKFVGDQSGRVHINTQYQLKGEDVFNFAAQIVPPSVESMLAKLNWTKESVDAFVFHQASRLVNETICKILRLDPAHTPSTLDRFANTSSATIPLTLVDQLGTKLREQTLRLLLCGFGVGLSWGTLACEIGPLVCPPIVEV